MQPMPAEGKAAIVHLNASRNVTQQVIPRQSPEKERHILIRHCTYYFEGFVHAKAFGEYKCYTTKLGEHKATKGGQ